MRFMMLMIPKGYEKAEPGAMPTAEARRLCPNGVYVSPRHDQYRAASVELMALLGEVTPLVEPVSLDEAYLDVSGAHSLLGESVQIATLFVNA